MKEESWSVLMSMPDVSTESQTAPAIAVFCPEPESESSARALASRLNLPWLGVVNPRHHTQYPLLLGVVQGRLSVVPTGKGAPGPVFADFVEGALAYRRLHGGGRGQPVARAVGLKPGIYPKVLDATAGLGRDAFVLAALGCEVVMLERSPIIAALLDDALARAALESEVAPIVARMTLIQADARQWLAQGLEPVADVIYLDPMFPHRDKSSLVKKEMRLFRELVGEDQDSSELLEMALQRARYRVVVKRPRLAPHLDSRTPTLVHEGKSGRFDIYTLKSLELLKGSN